MHRFSRLRKHAGVNLAEHPLRNGVVRDHESTYQAGTEQGRGRIALNDMATGGSPEHDGLCVAAGVTCPFGR
jgi:hypothetical protein